MRAFRFLNNSGAERRARPVHHRGHAGGGLRVQAVDRPGDRAEAGRLQGGVEAGRGGAAQADYRRAAQGVQEAEAERSVRDGAGQGEGGGDEGEERSSGIGKWNVATATAFLGRDYLYSPFVPGLTNLLYSNLGNGVFVDATATNTSQPGELDRTRAVALGDVDGDGDL